MATLNLPAYDRTLLEVDKCLEKKELENKPRKYLGMSQIGNECWRNLFYSFRGAEKRIISASGIKAIQDGFTQEDIMAGRLRMVSGIELWTLDPETNQQIAFSLLLDHFRGHCDGIIIGLIEAPKTPHVWEHKSVNEKKFAELVKARDKYGEKEALKNWDSVYYAQCQIYMHEARLERHFLTVTTPGGREYISIRTEYNKKEAEAIIAKAKSIIFDNWTIPARISDKREFFRCKWCEYSEICHDGKFPLVNCKTCRYMEPVKDGKFNCGKSDVEIEDEIFWTGCNYHIYNPALINADFIEHQEDCCLYRSGKMVWANCFASGLPELNGDIHAIYTSVMLREQVQFVSNVKAQEIEKPKQDKRLKV
jgi:CRISPR/Cas system-associated exonuclease Cas4 (RecB family)